MSKKTEFPRPAPIGRRVLFCGRPFYFDSSNGAAVATRALMGCLSRNGFGASVLCGTVIDAGPSGDDPARFLGERGWPVEPVESDTLMIGSSGIRHPVPPHIRSEVDGVEIAIHRRPLHRAWDADPEERREFLQLLEGTFSRARPDVLLTYGGDTLTRDILKYARERGTATVFALHNFAYNDAAMFGDVDAVIVPSHFAATYYASALGLECRVLPNPIDFGRLRRGRRDPRYVTFVNPSAEKGVFVFARIAEQLGRRRPDIPLLVVESRGDEGTLVACGIDLRTGGNVFLMPQTDDPSDFWDVTHTCLMPSLWWENQPLVAIEAMAHGIPVIGSDRGGIPEALGGGGLALPLPGRLTPQTRSLPTPEEVAPWVEAIIRFWDDPATHGEFARKALAEADRWRADLLDERYARFFRELRPGPAPRRGGGQLRTGWRALAPTLPGGDVGPERALAGLDQEGVLVRRASADSGLEMARNSLLTGALDDGGQVLLLIDPTVDFRPGDALRLMARPEPVLSGIPLRDGWCEPGYTLAADVLPAGCATLPAGMYPLDEFRPAFLRVDAEILRRMIDRFDLPVCRDRLGLAFRPFFQESVVRSKDGEARFLTPDETFAHRLRQMGVIPLADSSFPITRRRAEDVPGPPRSDERSRWDRAARTWDQIPGFFDFEAVYDAAVAEARDGARFVEIGTLIGRSTCYLATRIRESGKGIQLFAVDTCRGSPTDSTGQEIAPSFGGSYAGILHRNILGCALEDHVVPILTDSVRASGLFRDESIDFCFIDGDHSYASVIADLAAWWPKVRPGGLITGHDYRQPAPWLLDVTRAVHDFFGVEDAPHPLGPSCWMMRKSG